MNYLRLAFVTLLVYWAGCGPTINILPLRGEDPTVVAMIGSDSGFEEEDVAINATKRLIRLLHQRQVATFWNLLTPETQAALEALASKGGMTALDMLDSQRFTNPKDPEGEPIVVDVEALFFVRHPSQFQRIGNARSQMKRASVRIRNGKGGDRLLHLRKLDGHWCLHRTRFETLPPLTPKAVPLLPGQYTLRSEVKAKTPAPKTPTQEPSTEAPSPAPESPSTPQSTNDDF